MGVAPSDFGGVITKPHRKVLKVAIASYEHADGTYVCKTALAGIKPQVVPPRFSVVSLDLLRMGNPPADNSNEKGITKNKKKNSHAVETRVKKNEIYYYKTAEKQISGWRHLS